MFVPHATAGIADLETGSGSDEDLLAQLDVLLPATTAGGTGTAARGTAATTSCRPSCRHTPASQCSRALMLGVWQRICLVDTNTDNHQRHVRFSFLAG